ncbi:efflux transporter outer membrane subunit [Craterilacuibacter sp.]|uniref:efflux transporter outer membrane subunit n=1 Tax=Craterilacuibacter sp. TaxID=2870909 RepID=UPI003F3FE135
MLIKSLPLWIAIALTGCAVGPDYTRPVVEMPGAWQSGAQAPAAAQMIVVQDWWKSFNDPVLDKLVDEALVYNRNLAQAVARVDEARAQAGIARANLVPQLSANAGFQRGRTSADSAGGSQLSDARTANGVLSWELDLWGKLRRANEAALANLAASEYTRDATRLSISASVAQAYFQLRAYDAQLDITRRTLVSREEGLRINKRRFEGGVTSELTYRQAEAEAASARAGVPSLQQSVIQTENALAILLGRSPRALVDSKIARGAVAALQVPVDIPAGLPSDLLMRRPDLRAAEQQLKAANARIGVARAAYFPTIGLTGALGSQSTALDTLFSGPMRTWSFATNLAMPIFDWGKTGAGVDAASAQQKQALATYELAIQSAFGETLDALSFTQTSRDRQAALFTQLQALQESLRLARLRYDNGYSSYLEVLDSERGSYQAELQLVSARLDQLQAAINLYKALGGGWDSPQTQP